MVGVGVEQGIFIAIALSLFRHVRHSYKPHTMVLRPDTATGTMEVEPVRAGIQTEPGLIVYRFSSDLFYANCQRFAQDITLLVDTAPQPVHCLVVDCSAITDIDYSAARVVHDVLERLKAERIQVFSGVCCLMRGRIWSATILPRPWGSRIFSSSCMWRWRPRAGLQPADTLPDHVKSHEKDHAGEKACQPPG